MANLNGFNASQVEPSTGFDPLPAGKYLAMITESEMKPTKSSQGKYLQLTFQILDGQFKNRFVWARMNLENPKAETVQIARAELSAICRAIGVMTPRDSVDLHNIPLVITVRQKKQDDGELTNVIKGYARKDSLTGQPQQAATSPAAANQYAGTTPPWKR